jgi:hypothetical protein
VARFDEVIALWRCGHGRVRSRLLDRTAMISPLHDRIPVVYHGGFESESLSKMSLLPLILPLICDLLLRHVTGHVS